MVLLEDLKLAREFLARGGPAGHISKWTKDKYVSAAEGLALIIREVSGGPRVLKALENLAEHGHADPSVAMNIAVAALRRMPPLDISTGPAATSSQQPGAKGVMLGPNLSSVGMGDEGDANDDHRMLASGGAAHDGGGEDDGDEDNEEGRTHSSSAPKHNSAPYMPVAAAVAAGGGADAVVVPGGVGSAHKSLSATGESISKVCPYLWKRMLCRRLSCRFLHPELCANPNCVPNRDPNCAKFHGRFRGENGENRSRGELNKSNKTTKKHVQGNARRGAAAPHRGTTSKRKEENRRRETSSKVKRRPGRSTSVNSVNEDLLRSRRELAAAKEELVLLRMKEVTAPYAQQPIIGATATNACGTNHPMGRDCAPVQRRSSFAMVFAEALERALSSAGLHLTASS